MKTKTALGLILAAAVTVMAAAPVDAQAQSAQVSVLPDTTAWEVTSKAGHRYRIFAAWPKGEAPAGGWPVVYVLDANIMFGTMVDTVRAMERREASQPAVVIGIGYPLDLDPRIERARDLTARLGTQEPTLPGTGGAESFADFIANELKPSIATRFRIDPARETIFGHSYGGHFVLYTLVNRPELFDNWIAASPSLWFENQLLANHNVRDRIGPKLAATGATGRVLVTAGEYEQGIDPEFPNPRLPLLMERKMVDNAREYAEFLAAQPGIEARFEKIAGEDHGSVIPVAMTRGIRFVFAPGAKQPTPAPKPAPFKNPTRYKVPDAATYLKMTPEARYDLRMKVRRLPEAAQRKAWVEAFDRSLQTGLTYGPHRVLAEERIAMDKKHGTAPVD
ncbi:alpha/beta hydrolase [Sphingosinicella xenopeptidilytica]|uniref:Alpha/beta hydrolase n=1 Tax=Sphingosinicella xenopeptidilytica TaxID=364098 RepID=A0ABW3C3D8_SPHXN